MRGGKHHARYAGGALGPKDVVFDDEGIRFCGEGSTTSGTPAAPWGLKTWCLTTKEQGFAGSGAPRLVRRRRLGAQRRGAHRRRNKVLRGAEHHVRYAGDALGPKDVVLDDEGTRFCGRRSTTSHTPAEPRPAATAHQKRTDAQSVLLILLFCLIHPAFQSIRLDQVSPTSPSGFSWSSSWTAASSGFWHVPARSGRSAAGPWNRTGSNNSCC